MKQKYLLKLTILCFISIWLLPYSAKSQVGTLSNCNFVNQPIAAGDSAIFQFDWSCSGSGSTPQSIILQPPSGTEGAWNLSSLELIFSDMSDTWTPLQYPNGGIRLVYNSSVSDGNYARFSIKCKHDGASDTLSSGGVSAEPGEATCLIKIPVQNTLPITLRSFEVIQQNAAAKLHWITESESNSSHFDIEASADGRNFARIITVPSQADQNGNSNTALTYTYTDKLAASRAKVVYYRIKQVDLNGDYSYTDIRRIDLSDVKIPYVISPNPVLIGNRISVNGDFFTQVELYNALGQSVYSHSYDTEINSITIPTHELSPGLYSVVIDGESKISIMVQ